MSHEAEQDGSFEDERAYARAEERRERRLDARDAGDWRDGVPYAPRPRSPHVTGACGIDAAHSEEDHESDWTGTADYDAMTRKGLAEDDAVFRSEERRARDYDEGVIHDDDH